MTTTIPKKEKIVRNWVEIDAAGKTLGKVATLAASILQGKNKAIFTPNMDTGDFVLVTNAAGVRLTGKKGVQKFYYRASTQPGKLKRVSYGDLLEKRPAKLVEIAVRRMLPKNRLGRRLFTKLKVYAGTEHPHAAQQPKKIEVK